MKITKEDVQAYCKEYGLKWSKGFIHHVIEQANESLENDKSSGIPLFEKESYIGCAHEMLTGRA
jgi:hypothetical protein